MVTQKTTSKQNPAPKTAPKSTSVRAKTLKTADPGQPVKTEKPVKTYKGFCIFLLIFLYLQFFTLLFIYLKYDVSFETKRPYCGYTIQRHNLPAYRKRARLQKQHQMRQIQKATAPSQMRRPIRPKHHQGVKPTPVPKKTTTQTVAPGTAPKPVVKCPEPVARKAQYIEAQYAPYAAGGKAKIQGKACFALKDGSEKCLAGLDIYINPVTDYSNEWYERGWVGTEYLEVADERVIPFNKSVKTAQDGSFTFDNLAPGSYYVVTQLCLPTGKEAATCEYRRYGTKVTMKNLVKPTLKQIFPKGP